MPTAESMESRGAHYTALAATIEHQGAAKLHDGERQVLRDAADALLFGEPQSTGLVRRAEELIELLEASGRWSADACDGLREHLYGCDVPD